MQVLMTMTATARDGEGGAEWEAVVAVVVE